jgi:hypothetical protein
VSQADLAGFNNGVDIWLKQVKSVATEQYRDMVWEIFLRVVRETPQYTGKAVANWNISVGQPDFSFDDSLGDHDIWFDPPDPEGSGVAHPDDLRRKGDRKWMQIAWNRNRPRKDAIRYRDRVFISNGATGDSVTGDPNEGFAYIEALQQPGHWRKRLREENLPFESVQESLIYVMTKMTRWDDARPRYGTGDW